MIINTTGLEINEILFSGINNNSSQIQTMIDNIKRTFKSNPSYFQITKYPDNNTIYDCWIEDDLTAYKKTTSDKHLIMYPDQTINRGEVINWNNQQWIVTSKDMQTFPYDEGVIQYCNQQLNTILSNGKLISQPCIVEDVGRNDLNIEDLNNVQTQKTQLILVVQNNSDTIQIKPSWRLIFGRNVYKVLNFNDATEQGLIKFKIISDGERVGFDNWTTGIADNSVKETVIPTGITINGSNTIKTNETQTYTLNTTVGTYTWVVSDTSKVSIVSQTSTSITLKGLFYGQIKLTATDSNGNSYFKIISVQNGI